MSLLRDWKKVLLCQGVLEAELGFLAGLEMVLPSEGALKAELGPLAVWEKIPPP